MRNDLCKKCGNCCRLIPVDFSNRIMFRDGIQSLTPEFESMLEVVETQNNTTICKCKFLDANLCTNTNKPEECKNFPSSPFAFLPRNCGFEGEVFVAYERKKQKVRKLKEEIIHYEALIKTTSSKSEREQYTKIINSHNSFIQRYSRYGSIDW